MDLKVRARDVFSPDGRTVLARRFRAIGDPDDSDFELQLDVEVDDRGRPTCRQLQVRAVDDAPVTWDTLRRIPVERYMHQALARLSEMWVVDSRTADGNVTLVEPESGERKRTRRRLSKVSRRPRKGAHLSDEHLEEVTQVYRAALAERRSTAAAIRERWWVATPTADRWVAKARDRARQTGDTERFLDEPAKERQRARELSS